MRENTAYMRPPRALWVPFDLGRPFGAPDDAAFQQRVLRAVLSLLARDDGPVILEDFPDDAPGQGDPENMEGMVCPVPLRKPETSDAPDIVGNVLTEIGQLAPWQTLFRDSNSRTTVGVCDLDLTDAVRFLGDLHASGRSDAVAAGKQASTLRYASEDLRNFYLEAAAMRPGGAASRTQLMDWFWGDTAAGALLLALHPACMASGDDDLRHVADTMMIPRNQKHRLAN
ncbi:MAG: hypothetical protein ACR2PI_19575 [Hyphomicrobiaceae bacterium]